MIVTAPPNVTAPVVSLSTTVAAPTVPEIVVEALSVTVSVPTPATEATVIAPVAPASKVSALPPPLTAPTLRTAVPLSSVVSPARLSAAMSIWALVVDTVPCAVVAPAVVSRPPVKLMLSAAASPKVTPPVFRKVVSPATVPPSLNATA